MCARWNLEEFGVYSPMSGITNNQSEGFNSVLKRMQEWKEIPIDSAVLSLYHLQAFYWNEWQHGWLVSVISSADQTLLYSYLYRVGWIHICFTRVQKFVHKSY